MINGATAMIIDGRQSRIGRLVEGVLTLGGWLLLLFFFVQFVLLTLGIDFDVQIPLLAVDVEILGVVLITIGITALSTSLLWIWGWYNKAKFGGLNRRKFPLAVTDEELAGYFAVEVTWLRELQSKAWVDVQPGVILTAPEAREEGDQDRAREAS